MFPARYFAPRYFAPRYWPKVGQAAAITAVLLRASGIDARPVLLAGVDVADHFLAGEIVSVFVASADVQPVLLAGVEVYAVFLAGVDPMKFLAGSDTSPVLLAGADAASGPLLSGIDSV